MIHGFPESRIRGVTDAAIRLAGVRKSYSGHVAVESLSLSVPRGGAFGLLGPNGAGKTTTLRMVMNILRPDEGTIEILGAPAGQATRDRVGYMPEERGLYPRMALEEQLLFFAALKGVPRGEASRRLVPWLERMGLSAWRQRKLNELSKGMQQKAQFIATVLHDPEILILDEPLNGADPRQRVHFKRLLQQLAAAGRTIVLSSHILEEVEELADTVLLIINGKLAAAGEFRAIRAALDQRPYHVRILCDEPRKLASAIVTLPAVDAVHVDPDGAVVVLSRNVHDLQIELPRRAKHAAIRLRRVEPLDESLESVFGYVVEG